MKVLAPAFAWFVWAVCALAQVITTVAGTDFTFPATPIPAINAPLGAPFGLSTDAIGNVYVQDRLNSIVARISPDGILNIVAGNGIAGVTGDGGPATAASISPTAMTVDADGAIYIAGDRIGGFRKVTAGVITSVQANRPMVFFIAATVVDRAGNLFFADASGHRILKLAGGTVTTVAGTGVAGFSGDGGPATGASLNLPAGLALDAAGNLYIADQQNNRVRKVTPDGIISTVAGNGTSGFSGDGGPATSASLSDPVVLAVDSVGSLFIGDNFNHRVRKVTSSGTISTVAGNGGSISSGDRGPATNASLTGVGGVAVDGSGNLYILDGAVIRKVSPSGIISTFAGNGRFRFSGDGGPATSASLYLDIVPSAGLALDAAGNLYIADSTNRRVRKVSTNGIITTVAGNGVRAFAGDGGPATSASLQSPSGLALDAGGNLYVADSFDNRVRKVSTGGIITTVVGTGANGFSGDGGQATNATLNIPEGLAIDAKGDLYIADSGNVRVRKVSNGFITTVAGNGVNAVSGDGGAATNAATGAIAVALDNAGNLYIADFINNRVRKVSNGIITTFAGNGKAEFSGDGGAATDAAVFGPYGLAIDAQGSVYIAAYHNSRVRKVENGIITTVAGSGALGTLGDGGLATNATLTNPAGLAFDAAGNLFIADTFFKRVREVLASPPQAQSSPSQLQFTASSGGSIPPVRTASLTGTVSGLAFSVQADAPWLTVTPSSGSLPRLLEITADPTNLQSGTYTGTITVTTPLATPMTHTVTVTFTVTDAIPAKLAIDKQSLSFPFPRDGKARTQPVMVSNAGGGTLSFTATASTNAGGNWLSVAPSAGQVLPSAPALLNVTADPTGLAPRTYTGSVTISGGGDSQTVAVTMTVSAIAKAIVLSQAGLSFLGVSQGGVVPPQTFGVINIGSDVVNWTVSKSTLSGGPDWLQIGTTSGSTDASAATVPTVSVSANPASLAPGKYYGQVRVDSADAANSPQVVTIFLQVLPAGSDIGAVAQPAELLFAAPQGRLSPGSQDLLPYNVAAGPKTFRSVTAADPGLTILTLPTDGTLDPQRANRIVVQPITDGLKSGIYNGAVTLQFSDGRVRSLKVSVVVAAGTAVTTGSNPVRRADDSTCTPTKLLTALTTLGQSFAVSAGWPVALGIDVKDDCGTALDAGSVTVNFSNGDPQLSLRSLKGGHWETTWMTRTNAAQVILKLQATDSQGALRGERQVSGALQAQTDPPVFDKPGVVSAASGQPFAPLAPGSIVSIFGDRLAQTLQVAVSDPLPTTLLSTSVLIGGKPAPLYMVSQNQVNVQVPFDLNINTTQQILVQQGATYSQPVAIDVAPAQPAIFTDASVAPNQGVVIDLQTQLEAKPGTPATAGDMIVIYCAGLGAVSPALPAGASAGPGISTANDVQVTIGGVNTPASFAGLTPRLIGMYQVNTIVPSGVPAGDAIPVVLSVSGLMSPPVTMAIQ